MSRSYEDLASEIEFLKVQQLYHASQCGKYQKAITARITGLMCFTYIGQGDETEKIILEEPKADSAIEIQSYVRLLANNMADFHHAKVLLLTEQIEQLSQEIITRNLSATQVGKGGSVSHGTAPRGTANA